MKKNPLLLPKQNLVKPMIIKPQKGKSYNHNTLRGKKLEPLNPHLVPLSNNNNNTLSSLPTSEQKSNFNSFRPKPEKKPNIIENSDDQDADKFSDNDQDANKYSVGEDDPMLHGPVNMFVSEDTPDENEQDYYEENNEYEEDNLSDRFAD